MRAKNTIYYIIGKTLKNIGNFRSDLKDSEFTTKYVPKEVKVMEIII